MQIDLTLPNLIDSVLLEYGDGTDTLLVGDILERDIITIRHAYDETGTMVITITVYAGTSVKTASDEVVILCTKPDISSINGPDTAKTGDTVQLTISVTGSHPCTLTWLRNGAGFDSTQGCTLVLANVSPDDSGSYRVIAVNPCGRDTTPAFHLFIASDGPDTVDSLPPAIEVVSHDSGQTVSNASVTLRIRATDPAGVNRVTVNGDAATNTGSGGIYEFDAALTDGANEFIIYAEDASPAKNAGSLSFLLNYDSTAQDTVPPVISLISHTDGQVVTVASVLLRVSATDANGIQRVVINNSEAASVSGGYETTVSLHSGSNTSTASAWDASSVHNSDTVTWSPVYDSTAQDSTPPVINLVTPSSARVTVTQTPITVKVTASDDNNVARLTINGTTVDYANGAYERSVDLQEGPNQVRVIAMDGSLNANRDTLDVAVTYDPPPGAITISSSAILYNGYTISWDQSTAVDFNSYKICYSQQPDVVSSIGITITTKATTSYEITGLAENTTYYVKVFVFDTHGSATGSNELSVKTAINNPPTITLSSPVNGRTKVVQSSSSFQYSGSDPEGGSVSFALFLATSQSGLLTNGQKIENLTVNSYEMANFTTFKPGSRYYWCVIAADAQGKKDTSSISIFWTKNEEPVWNQLPATGDTTYYRVTWNLSNMLMYFAHTT